MLPILPIIFVLRALTGNKGAVSTGPPIVVVSGRSVLWALGALGFVVWDVATIAVIANAHGRWDAARACLYVLVALAWGAALFFAFDLLRMLARRGRAKTVYYLAHALMVFPRTSETYAGAALLAALAYAHRGDVTEAEMAWVRTRLAKETHALGTFATAHGLLEAMAARSAADAGRTQEALDRGERSHRLLGTVTYMSSAGVHWAVRRLVHEILALGSARDGAWPMLLDKGSRLPARSHRALRAWVRETFMDEKPSWLDRRARRSMRSTELEKLHARPKSEPIESQEEARIVASETYVALVRGEPVGPEAALRMLTIIDMFLHPSFEGCVVPAELREDQAFMDQMATEVATALAEPLSRRGIPLHALERLGPVSARVYAILEAAIEGELLRVLAGVEERVEALNQAHRLLGDPIEEWYLASYLRGLFRRLEFTLGDASAARLFNRYLYVSTKLAVRFSETWPRMRPLAHAMFHSLHNDAKRFGDKNVELMANNMRITRGVS